MVIISNFCSNFQEKHDRAGPLPHQSHVDQRILLRFAALVTSALVLREHVFIVRSFSKCMSITYISMNKMTMVIKNSCFLWTQFKTIIPTVRYNSTIKFFDFGLVDFKTCKRLVRMPFRI